MEEFDNFDDIFGEDDVEATNGGSVELPPIIKQPIKAWKIVLICIMGLLFCGLIFLLVGSLYTRYIRFPDQEYIDPATTGAYAINQYEGMVHNQQSLTTEDYLIKEQTYANSNEVHLNFIKAVVNTVHYSYDTVNAKNIFGNDMIDKETMSIVTIPSPVWSGEEVNLSYIDYGSIEFESDEATIALAKVIDRYGLTVQDVDYSNTLVNMFCYYISTMPEIPIRTDRRVPELIDLNGSYAMSADEDIYLDKLLFSSDDFLDCQMRFAEAVGRVITGSDLVVSKEWTEWSELPDVKRETTNEPLKYGKQSIAQNWCGAYYLINEYYVYGENGEKLKGDDSPLLGDGTFSNPASKGTPVITYMFDDAGNKYPIRVELTEFGVSEDALTWFQTKDIQNRGYTLNSEVQYCYAIFKVTNLSNVTLNVWENGALCDKNANLSTRTGIIYGITDNLTLAPDEEGLVEFWGRSTELHKKYLIWGSNFARRQEPVWFRVLSGDLEDTSEYKGVHVITPGGSKQDVSEITDDSVALTSSPEISITSAAG